MCRILIFGGTTEGRLLAEFCDREGIEAFVSVVSEYGKGMLKKSPYIKVKTAPMDAGEMEAFIRANEIRLVVDATHPYALLATEHIKRACEAAGAVRIRCVRDMDDLGGERAGEEEKKDGRTVFVSDSREAVRYLEGREGAIFLTTGSKELSVFTGLRDYRERLYARVLPSPEILKACESLLLPMGHVFGMQGPFSKELNKAMMNQISARYMVTKETGQAGGYKEKLDAAGELGVTSVIIRRKKETDGMRVKDACLLLRELGTRPSDSRIILAGIGPGSPSLVTGEVAEAIRRCDLLIGAPRMLDTAKAILGDQMVPGIPEYLPERVAGELERYIARGVKRPVILFSGDTGFYSGMKKLKTLLKERNVDFSVLSGISSVSYMAARLKTCWEDAELLTAHGRELYLPSVLRGGKKRMFVLLGGENGAGKAVRQLCSGGFSHCRVSVGENLSYDEEQIVTGTAKELKDMVFGSLCLMLIEDGTGDITEDTCKREVDA